MADDIHHSDMPPVEQMLCFAVYAAGHAFGRVYTPLLRQTGLTYPQFLVMVVLWERDGVTVGDIGERLGLESSTLTPLLKRLEAAGHVRRRRDTVDERQVLVVLTRQGRALRARARDIPLAVLAATGGGAERAARLRADLVALRSALDRAAAA